MKKLNLCGQNLLESKRELLKNYSKIVNHALIASTQEVLDTIKNSMPVFEAYKDMTISEEDFLAIILDNPNFAKSEEEIRKEMLEKAEEFKKDLVENYFLLDLNVDVNSKDGEVLFFKEIAFTADYFRDYFDIPDDALIALMKPKSIGERVSKLRLAKFERVIEKEMKQEISKGILYVSEFKTAKDKYFKNVGLTYKFEDLEDEEEYIKAEIKKLNDYLVPYLKREMVL